ncbi:hypothetical protein C8J57DRAFT_998982, partial [Mycena rebaudengoi]
KCSKMLKANHCVRTIQEMLIIANRETVTTRKPHQGNPSRIGRKSCDCTLCYRDRAQLGCEHPGECIETAKILLDSIMPKWNLTVPSPDLCDELELTAMEREENTCPSESDRITTFNPDFTLSNMRSGFRIFAFGESLNDVAARRYKVPEQVPDQIKIFIHARILHPG